MDKELIEKLIAKINDKLAKVVLQMPESAIEYVSAFLPEIAESLDLEDMVLQNSNFLDKHLGEYFCDAIYETHLKQESSEDPKNKIRIILLFEHKTSIDSYFDLFLQLLGYIVLLWQKDRAASLPPTIVLPLVLYQGTNTLKIKTLHDALKSLPSFKDIPEYLLQFIPQMTFHVLNVQPLANEKILGLRVEGLLRSLLLSMVVVEDKNRIEDPLLEVFRFMDNKPQWGDFFSPFFHFLLQKGQFTKEELSDIKNYYHLTPNQERVMMTTMQVLKQEGRQEGRQEGEQKTKRLTVLRGHFRKLKADTLTDISGLTSPEVVLLIHGFEAVKKAWKKHNVNITELTTTTMLSEEEVDFIVECLESVPKKA